MQELVVYFTWDLLILKFVIELPEISIFKALQNLHLIKLVVI